MTNGAKPDRADVCIIGAGASGAAAAKVLTERGMPVVMLERGPWRTRETFGGDELANVNRYNLWPDPLLNPRTVRDSIDGEFRTELFCPVQQMVGGGTALRSDLPPASAVRCSDQWLAGYQESALTRWKRLITADPTDADFVYAVWDRVQAAAPDDPATPFSGDTLFARSTDGGETWGAGPDDPRRPRQQQHPVARQPDRRPRRRHVRQRL